MLYLTQYYLRNFKFMSFKNVLLHQAVKWLKEKYEYVYRLFLYIFTFLFSISLNFTILQYFVINTHNNICCFKK